MTKRRGGKRTNRGDDAKMKLNIKVGGTAEQIVIHHEWDVSGIGKQFKDDFAHLQTQIMDLQEQAVREKLIELGWTPPREKGTGWNIGGGMDFDRYKYNPEGRTHQTAEGTTVIHDEVTTMGPNAWTRLNQNIENLNRAANPPIVVTTATDGVELQMGVDNGRPEDV